MSEKGRIGLRLSAPCASEIVPSIRELVQAGAVLLASIGEKMTEQMRVERRDAEQRMQDKARCEQEGDASTLLVASETDVQERLLSALAQRSDFARLPSVRQEQAEVVSTLAQQLEQSERARDQEKLEREIERRKLADSRSALEEAHVREREAWEKERVEWEKERVKWEGERAAAEEAREAEERARQIESGKAAERDEGREREICALRENVNLLR